MIFVVAIYAVSQVVDPYYIFNCQIWFVINHLGTKNWSFNYFLIALDPSQNMIN